MKAVIFLLPLAVLSLILLSCASEDMDTCEQDKIDGNWKRIISSDYCSSTEKGEAYLALGGFNYFSFITEQTPDLIAMLGLNASSWERKKGYFDSAVDLVGSLHSGTQKTIYLFGSYLGLFTYTTGSLDNGANGDAIAFDGVIDAVETSYFTGSGLKPNSGGSETDLVATDNYQFMLEGSNQYYVIDSATLSTGPPYAVYRDTNSDGSGDVALSEAEATAIVADIMVDGLRQLNQVILMDVLEDPFASRANLNVLQVNEFASTTYDYLAQIELAMTALNVDPSKDEFREIQDLRLLLDNGGVCETLQANPIVLLVHYFATNLQELPIDDYSAVNLLRASKLVQYGADVTFDANDLSSTYSVSDLGVKILFLKSDTTGYVPYWSDATTDIVDTMNVFNAFSANEVAVDGKVVFAEIVCASELLSGE